MNPYEKLLNRKRKWTPVQTTAGLCKEGAEGAVHRALALRSMEVPVGDFIRDALANAEVPSTGTGTTRIQRQGRGKPRPGSWLHRQCLRGG